MRRGFDIIIEFNPNNLITIIYLEVIRVGELRHFAGSVQVFHYFNLCRPHHKTGNPDLFRLIFLAISHFPAEGFNIVFFRLLYIFDGNAYMVYEVSIYFFGHYCFSYCVFSTCFSINPLIPFTKIMSSCIFCGGIKNSNLIDPLITTTALPSSTLLLFGSSKNLICK